MLLRQLDKTSHLQLLEAKRDSMTVEEKQAIAHELVEI